MDLSSARSVASSSRLLAKRPNNRPCRLTARCNALQDRLAHLKPIRDDVASYVLDVERIAWPVPCNCALFTAILATQPTRAVPRTDLQDSHRSYFINAHANADVEPAADLSRRGLLAAAAIAAVSFAQSAEAKPLVQDKAPIPGEGLLSSFQKTQSASKKVCFPLTHVHKSRHDHLHVLTPNDNFPYDACV